MKMKKPLVVITFLLLSIASLTMLRIALVNSISTTGIELAAIQEELTTYKKQNQILEERYLEASSLTNIEKRAEKLGFIEAKSQLYMSTPLPLALNQ